MDENPELLQAWHAEPGRFAKIMITLDQETTVQVD
jgi:hypothetical protein